MKHFSIILIAIMITATIQGQSWLDTTLYQFKSKYVQLQSGRMHYVDEGKGDVILFVHGTPTWSFLYRNFIKDLSKDYRCIAVDHIGFGLSEKPASFTGKIEDHSKNLAELINKLNLNNITLVVHDFGGPIGLSAGIANPERIKKVVMFNTWLWSTKNDPAAKQIDQLLNSDAGKDYYLNMNYSPTVLLKEAFYDQTNLSEAVHKHYIEPFGEKSSRIHLLNIGKQFVGASDWYEEQWNKLSLLADKEWLILWGTKDPFLSTLYLNKWKGKLLRAKAIEYECGHFVQEEKGKEAIAAIRGFLKK